MRDTPLYGDGGRDNLSLQGRALYLGLFRLVVKLDAVFRQQDPAFAACLHRVRTAAVTDDDLRLLQSRSREALSVEELLLFETAPRLFSTRAAVENFNMQQLAKATSKFAPFHAIAGLPDRVDHQAAVAKIQAKHSGVRRGMTV